MARGTLLAALAATTLIGAAPPPPLASYTVDVATTSGFGAGMAGGGRPGLGQIMSMMRGGGGGAMRTLDLRLSARNGVTGTASHLPPATLGLGPQLPLIPPEPVVRTPRERPNEMPTTPERPQGRMLIYWGCGEHVGPGQPLVIDFAKMIPGQVPPGMMAMAMGARHAIARASLDPKAARWPNPRDSRPVPANGSLLGAHRVEASYAPAIGFTLGAGQDFMPALDVGERGTLPSGAARLGWTMAPQATGYALGLFGAGGGAGGAGGEMIIWSSAKISGRFPDMDYLAPAEVRRQIVAGAVLAPNVSECLLPAEVARAAPNGLVTMIGYGPEAGFAEAPRAAKWVVKARFKSSATMIRGLSMEGDGSRSGEPPRKRKRFGIGDMLRGAIPIPRP